MFDKKECFDVVFQEIHSGFYLREKGRSFYLDVPKTGKKKGTGTNTRKSGTRNVESESIRSREEGTVERVKLSVRHNNLPR